MGRRAETCPPSHSHASGSRVCLRCSECNQTSTANGLGLRLGTHLGGHPDTSPVATTLTTQRLPKAPPPPYVRLGLGETGPAPRPICRPQGCGCLRLAPPLDAPSVHPWVARMAFRSRCDGQPVPVVWSRHLMAPADAAARSFARAQAPAHWMARASRQPRCPRRASWRNAAACRHSGTMVRPQDTTHAYACLGAVRLAFLANPPPPRRAAAPACCHGRRRASPKYEQSWGLINCGSPALLGFRAR